MTDKLPSDRDTCLCNFYKYQQHLSRMSRRQAISGVLSPRCKHLHCISNRLPLHLSNLYHTVMPSRTFELVFNFRCHISTALTSLSLRQAPTRSASPTASSLRVYSIILAACQHCRLQFRPGATAALTTAQPPPGIRRNECAGSASPGWTGFRGVAQR